MVITKICFSQIYFCFCQHEKVLRLEFCSWCGFNTGSCGRDLWWCLNPVYQRADYQLASPARVAVHLWAAVPLIIVLCDGQLVVKEAQSSKRKTKLLVQARSGLFVLNFGLLIRNTQNLFDYFYTPALFLYYCFCVNLNLKNAAIKTANK